MGNSHSIFEIIPATGERFSTVDSYQGFSSSYSLAALSAPFLVQSITAFFYWYQYL